MWHIDIDLSFIEAFDLICGKELNKVKNKEVSNLLFKDKTINNWNT